MEKKLVYTGKTKDVFALENGNYLLKFWLSAMTLWLPSWTPSAFPMPRPFWLRTLPSRQN